LHDAAYRPPAIEANPLYQAEVLEKQGWHDANLQHAGFLQREKIPDHLKSKPLALFGMKLYAKNVISPNR